MKRILLVLSLFASPSFAITDEENSILNDLTTYFETSPSFEGDIITACIARTTDCVVVDRTEQNRSISVMGAKDTPPVHEGQEPGSAFQKTNVKELLEAVAGTMKTSGKAKMKFTTSTTTSSDSVTTTTTVEIEISVDVGGKGKGK